MSGSILLNAGWFISILNVRRSMMKEIVEGLRGPALGVVFVIVALAGTIVVAAFAALVAQMSLLLRLRSRETNPNTQTNNGYRVAESRQSPPSAHYPSSKDPGFEQTGAEVVEGVWWQSQ
jgi:hypothetical protein